MPDIARPSTATPDPVTIGIVAVPEADMLWLATTEAVIRGRDADPLAATTCPILTDAATANVAAPDAARTNDAVPEALIPRSVAIARTGLPTAAVAAADRAGAVAAADALSKP